MPFGIEFFFPMLLASAAPAVSYAIGVHRTRRHFIAQSRFRRYGRRVLAVYYGVLVLIYGIITTVAVRGGGEIPSLAVLGCFSVLSGPFVALVLLIRAQDFRVWAIPTHCRGCGYPISMSHSRICPECGMEQES